jgi:formylglycine-generating enzyme required for sulfatase activity
MIRLRTLVVPALVLSLTAACAAVLGIEEKITNDPAPGPTTDDAPSGEDRTEPVDSQPSDTGVDSGPKLPSCVALQGTTCGTQKHDCCSTLPVPGGTFNRSNDPAFPAGVADFRLDEFEVTVGRFRAFVNAYPGSKPSADAGARDNIKGSGWDPAWDSNLPADQAALKAQLACNFMRTYEHDASLLDAGQNENNPINCVTWYVAFAFCVWDGGHLPTEAEWNIAAAAGTEQRIRAWGNGPFESAKGTFGPSGPDLVGSKSPGGDGKYGHADLIGNMSEWTLDNNVAYTNPCLNCATIDAGLTAPRVRRGGDWEFGGTDPDAASLNTISRGFGTIPTDARHDLGIRCAHFK